MKTFEPGFFDTKNFIASVETFDYREPEDKRPVCHICYNVNDAFIMIMGASVVSVLENNKDMSFVVHIFTDGYSADNGEKIKKMAEMWKCCCVLYKYDMTPFLDFHIKVERFSRITYGRIYMPKVLAGKAKRFIYIDADVMCLKSIKALYNWDMEGKPMGAVSERPRSVVSTCQFLKLKNGKYFNDGVMLVDVDQWNKDDITEKAFAYQREPKKRFSGQSQDVLNLVFDGSNYFLPIDYNRLGGGTHTDEKTVFVHWTGRRKPWQMVLTAFDAQWRKYNELSPWETLTNVMPIKKPENYHDFKEWAHYQREHGKKKDYWEGILWYSLLKIRDKSGI